MSLRIIAISFLVICGSQYSAFAGSFTIDEWILAVGAGSFSPNENESFLSAVHNPFESVHSVSFEQSFAAATYDFFWDDLTGFFRTDTSLESATANAVTNRGVAAAQIDITVTEPISILVDAELNFDLPMDQMRAGMSVSYFGINGTPGGGGQSFNYNTIFGTGPNSFVYEDQFDIPPGQYLLAYSMDIDATPSSAGAVGTADGFVEFRIVPEPTMTLPMMLCAAALTRRRFRRRAGAMPTQPN